MLETIDYLIVGGLVVIPAALRFVWTRTHPDRMTEEEEMMEIEEERESNDVISTLQEIKTLPAQFGQQLTNFGSSFGEQLKAERMSYLGKMSGESRQMKALNNDIALEGLGQNFPVAEMLASASPEMQKYLVKYPFLASLVQGAAVKLLPQFAQGLNPQGQPPPTQPNGSGKIPALPGV